MIFKVNKLLGFSKLILLISICLFTFALRANQLGQEVPTLIDIQLNASNNVAFFSPSNLLLETNKLYLLMISNPYQRSYTFSYYELKNALETKYINGSPSVSEQSIMLAPHSKVQWLVEAKQPGKYEFFEGF